MIRLIAAIDLKRGIAKHGVQPWKIPEDEKYFNEQTTGKGGVVLMGRRTFQLIRHPLPHRRNIVLSREPISKYDIETSADLRILNTLSDVWVIGGASVFEQTIDKADELYLTQIEADFQCDQFFPEFADKFKLVEESEPHEQNGFRFRYQVWRRA